MIISEIEKTTYTNLPIGHIAVPLGGTTTKISISDLILLFNKHYLILKDVWIEVLSLLNSRNPIEVIE